MRLDRYWVAVRHGWWVLLISSVVALGVGFGYLKWRPAVYVSKSRMWVTGKLKIGDVGQYTEDLQNFTGTQIALMLSAEIQSRALNRLMELKPDFKPPKGDDGNIIFPIVQINPTKSSSVFSLEAYSRQSEFAQFYLDALMQSFLAYREEVRARSSGNALASVSRQLNKKEIDLKEAMKEFSEYQRTNNVALLQQESAGGGAQLAQLKAQLFADQLEVKLMDVDALEKNALSRLKTKESAASEKEAHREALRLRMDNLQGAIKELEDKVGDSTRRLADLDRLKSNIQRQQGYYDRLLALLESVDINKSLDQESINILEKASSSVPANKPALLALPAAMAIGLLVGVGVLFLVARFDDRCDSLEELGTRFQEEIVGQLPNIRSAKSNGHLPLIELEGENATFAESCRNLRSALIYGFTSESRPKSILIASAAPGEGKSTVATNLAFALAYGGARVLLVDGDLRRGRLHKTLGTPCDPGLSDLLSDQKNAESGKQKVEMSVSDVPSHPSTGTPAHSPTEALSSGLTGCFHATALPNLIFLPRGKTATNGSELFLSNAFMDFMEKARREFDYIVMDSVPVCAADDTTTVAPNLDGVLFVVRSAHTRSRLANKALDLLYQRQAKILGLVFNCVNPRSNSYHYSKYAYYHGNSVKTSNLSEPKAVDAKPAAPRASNSDSEAGGNEEC